MRESYRVVSKRIGRGVEPLLVQVEDADKLVQRVYDNARPQLLSRDVEVVVNLSERRGAIFAGMNNGGSFTVERVSAEEVTVR